MYILKKPLNHRGMIIDAGKPLPGGLSEEVIKNMLKSGAVAEEEPEALPVGEQTEDDGENANQGEQAEPTGEGQEGQPEEVTADGQPAVGRTKK